MILEQIGHRQCPAVKKRTFAGFSIVSVCCFTWILCIERKRWYHLYKQSEPGSGHEECNACLVKHLKHLKGFTTFEPDCIVLHVLWGAFHV